MFENTFIFVAKHLPHAGNHTARLVDTPDLEGNWELRYLPEANPSNVTYFRIEGRTGVEGDYEGLLFRSDLASIDGARFTLFLGPYTNDNQRHEAERWLHNNFDVVGRIETVQIHYWRDDRPNQIGAHV